MSSRERNRYLLCEIIADRSLGPQLSPDNILFAFRENVLSLWGELGLASFGSSSKVVISFADFCGLFIMRVPAKSISESVMCLSSVIIVGSKACSIRILHISGRFTNTTTVTIDRLLFWRNSLIPEFAIPRKAQLDAQLRKSVDSVLSLPSYV
jgi:RNase P/RNase MRP subunit POP5